MNSELVKRLNDLAAVEGEPTAGALKKAANHIEDLNFQIKVIQGAAAHALKSYKEHLAVYRQKLDEKPPVWHDDIQSLQERDAIMTNRIEKLEAENAELQSKVNTVRLAAKYAAEIRDGCIKMLELALNDMAQYVSQEDWDCFLKPETRKALEGKDGVD